ncbi:hypothetical protein PITCH_A1070021 [uncultured Desulfobacterium sp.]|uniref:Uncharacterized protein n=1 Tax=uncultured Desulfobacterium sp. TaxID=201089 RepID=A0A445MQU5_9BACT|nr:hypothetical protein PITCH_A1070021 [uncultured Desulfobacterium sp.]
MDVIGRILDIIMGIIMNITGVMEVITGHTGQIVIGIGMTEIDAFKCTVV